MVITYYGASCFKIQSGDVILVFDPPSKKSGLKTPRFQADVVFVSHDHTNHSGSDNIPGREKDSLPLIIDSPGEYEVHGVTVVGVGTFHDSSGGKKYGLNTVYVLNFEGIKICHLGDFGENEIRSDVLEALGEVDILLTPIGGVGLSEEQAVKLISQIEPKIIIPMHYFTKDFALDKKCLSAFLKEIGQEKTAPMEKLTLKKKDLDGKNGEVAVLDPLIN